MFDDINNLFTKENLPPVYMEVQKEIFMINRFLSMLRRTFTSAQKSNLLSTKLPNRAAYLHLFHMVPAEKNPPRIPYIKKAVIVQAGDWNDKARSWDVLYKTVKMIMEYGLDILTIPGQHDMYHGVSEESTPTILSVLRASKLVTILGKEPVKLGGVNFYGAPWGAKVPSIITSGTNILVIHAPIMKEAIYYGAEGINPKRFLKKHKFDIVLAGDIHREFTEKFSKRRLFNTGPVLRKSADLVTGFLKFNYSVNISMVRKSKMSKPHFLCRFRKGIFHPKPIQITILSMHMEMSKHLILHHIIFKFFFRNKPHRQSNLHFNVVKVFNNTP